MTAWTRYKYRVRALNADGLSEESVPASVWNKGNGTTLVSNSTPSPISKLPVDAPGTAYLQGFTTGNQDATVESITLLSPTGVNSASRISVEIYEAVGNTEPGERLHTLTAPRRLKNNEHATFTAQADSPIVLRANTAYFVKIESVNDSFHLSTSVSDGEDAESASGWLLDDSCLLRDGTQYVDCDLSKALRISINGSEGTPPLPFLNMSNGRAVAGEGSPVEFAVTLNREAADAVTVEYSTSDGTATADVNATGGQDYTPVSGQTLTIAAGDTEGTISVSTGDDTAYEDNETFTLTLSNPSQNARLGSIVTATGTIINNDADMTLPPAAPQRLTATANDDGTVSLTWDDPEDPTITGYQILRRRPAVNLPGIRKLLMDDTGSAAASFVDTKTTGGTFYAYQVRARNGNGLSGNSTIANVLTRRNSTTLVSNIDQEPALTQPILMGGTGEPSTFLQGFKTGSQDARVESVTLTRPTDVSGGAELSVGIYEKGEDTLPAAHLYTLSPSGTLTSGQDATFTAQAGSTMSLSANTAYYLKVDHVAGSLSLSTTQSDAEDGESAPRWRLDDVCLNKDRTPSQYADCDFSKVLRVSINGVEVLPADIQPPAAPQGLTATGHDDGTISFTWDDPEDPAVSGYQVWRANAGFTTITIGFKKIVNDTGSAATSFVDRKTTAGTSYIYRVRARNAFGQSEDSNHVSIDTPAVFEVSDTQDSTTLVSNTNQDPALTSSVYIGGPGDPAIYLQGFMTGSQDAQVESVTLATPTNVSNGAELTVGIYEKGENTLLGAQFYTLTPSGTLTSRRDATFTAQAGSTIRLSANTAYFVKVDHVAGSLSLSATRSEAEDGESAPGWLVNNVCLDQVSSSSQVTNCGFSKALRISINGFEGSPSLPLLSLSSDAALSAFELEDHSGTGIALTPAFDPTTNVYTATVAYVVDSVTLSTTKNHAGATVAVLTESGTSTPDEATVDVAVGDNLIKAIVSSEDGTVSRIYMVTVTRAGSAADEVGFAVQQQGASNTPTTGQPTITGTAQVGEMLTADTSGITDTDGLTNVTYSYQWLGDDTDIAGATSSTYTLAETDEGQTIKVRVIVTDDAENETTLTSEATDAVEAAAQPDSPATGEPTITGTAQVGEMLTADTSGITDTDGLTNVTYSYQWLGDDTDIAGATSSTYTLVADDEGKTIKVRVVVTDDEENETTLTSAATEAVEAPEPPAKPTGLSAVVFHDTVTLAWDDPQDDAITGYVILRRDREIHLVGTFVTITDDTGSAQTTYTDDTVEPDKEYVYRIKAINEHGEESEISHWIRADTPAVPVPDKPTGLSTVVSYNTVTLTWDDPQDDSITGYVILRRDREIHPEGTFVTITDDTGSAQTTYTDDTVEPDKEYVYRIKAINEHGEESEISHWIRADTPAVPVPDKPTGLSVVVSHDTVTLTWDNPQDDSITGYVILRRDREIHPEGTFVTITDDTGSTDTTYTDDTVEPDKEYVYRIKAINEHGEESEISHWIRGFTPAAPAPAGSLAQ